MNDYDVVWSGKGPLPGMSYEGWVYKRALLPEHAPGSQNIITVRESKAAHVPPADTSYSNKQAGRKVTSKNRTERCDCGRKKDIDATICTGCRRGKKQRKKAA